MDQDLAHLLHCEIHAHASGRRLLAIEKLDSNEKRQVLQLIDAFIERGQLRSKVQGRSAS